ncbi:hypothetical protein D3C76_571370 [compost metagenome]
MVVAEHLEHARDRHAGAVHRHQDHRLLAVRRGVRIGLAHHDGDRAARVADPARPPLAAIDHVVVAVADDAGLDVGGVRGGHLRLGHQERRADLAVHQRRQPALLLLGAAVAQQHLHVAAVRRRAVEQLGRPGHLARFLGDQRVFEIAQPGAFEVVFVHLAAVGRRHEQVPQAGLARLALEFLDHWYGLPAVALVDFRFVAVLGGVDVFLHEGGDAVAPVGLCCGEREIHRCASVMSGWGRLQA